MKLRVTGLLDHTVCASTIFLRFFLGGGGGGWGTFSGHLQFPMVIAKMTFLNTMNNFEVLLRYADS